MLKAHAVLKDNKLTHLSQTSIIQGVFCVSEDNVVIKETPYRIRMNLDLVPRERLRDYQVLEWGTENVGAKVEELEALFESLGIDDYSVVRYINYRE